MANKKVSKNRPRSVRRRMKKISSQKSLEKKETNVLRESCSESFSTDLPMNTIPTAGITDLEEDTVMDTTIHNVAVPCKCRLCLREITSLATPIWGDSGISDIVLRCSAVNVLETDEFQFVCLSCKRHLDCANKFQQMCLKSNEIFLKITFIKNEDPFSDSLYQHEIKIEPLNEIKIEWCDEDTLEDFHSHEEDAIETATIFDREDEKEKEYPCEKCPMISYKEDDHLIHLTSHRVPRSKISNECELCPICGKILRYNDITKHIQLHTQQPLECDECGKMLSSKESLQQHKRRHRPQVLLDCTLCGCKVTRHALVRHMECVHKKLETSCSFCGRKFNCRYNLTVHLRTHTGEMPYSCPDCGKSFAHRVTMKLHRLKEHKVNMFDPLTEAQKEGHKRKRKKTNKEDNSASVFYE